MSMPERRTDAARNTGGALDQLARDRSGSRESSRSTATLVLARSKSAGKFCNGGSGPPAATHAGTVMPAP